MSPQRAHYNLDLPLLHSCAQQLVDPRRDLGERANHVARRHAPLRRRVGRLSVRVKEERVHADRPGRKVVLLEVVPDVQHLRSGDR